MDTSEEKAVECLLDKAREEGAEYPTFADSSDNEPIIVDTASGRTWMVELREF